MKKTIFLIAALVGFSQMAFSQCFPNRHSTNFFDGWVSCEPAQSPNPARPVSHFIMYDFGKVFKLGQMTFWNSNDPAHLDWGMRDVAIDYSTDGETWLATGDYTFSTDESLSGSNSVLFILDKRVPYPSGNPQHSPILDMNTGACVGKICRFYERED